jgi:dTDP-glucose pyrophosphorylase
VSNKFRNIFFFIGLAAVVIMVLTLDVSFAELWQQILHAGYWLVAIIVMWLGLYCMNALTWRTIIRGSGTCPIPFLQLLKVTISGFALNYATPFGLLGGEPYKIMEMKPYIGVQRASSSVVLFAMMHIFSHFWYWLTAVVLYLLFMPLNVFTGIILLLTTIFCLAAIYLFSKGYKNGMVVRLIRFIGHLPGLRHWAQRFAESHADDLKKIDAQIAALQSQNRRSFFTAFFLEYFGRILQSFEIFFMLLLFAEAPANGLTFVHSLIILAFTSLFANLLFFLPLQLGGREGGFAMSVGSFYTAQVSMGVSLLVRVRELVWTFVGLLLIKLGNSHPSSTLATTESLPDSQDNEDKHVPLTFAILAAGEGSRLMHEGVATPKPLVPIHGKAMIDRLIRIFVDCGANDIVVITNDRYPEIRQHLENLQAQGLPLRFIVRTTPSSMHSLHALKTLLGEGRFCLTTVDTIFRPEEFRSFIDAFQRSDVDGMMAVTDYVDDERPLWISTDDALRITGFHDQRPPQCQYISGGIYCLSEKCFPILDRCIAEGQSRLRNFQRRLVEEGLHLRAYPFSKILDVDHASDITKAEEFLSV